jgi:hypothetical protein
MSLIPFNFLAQYAVGLSVGKEETRILFLIMCKISRYLVLIHIIQMIKGTAVTGLDHSA